jgi:hypothetical protein
MSRRTLAVALLLAAPLPLAGQQRTVSTTPETISAVVMIEGIDHTNRLLTLKDTSGETETVYAGPSVARFDELKVGDKIKLQYYESVVYQLRKPGDPPLTPTDKTAATPGKGAMPGGTLSRQQTASVTVVAVDAKAPSITVQSSDGRKVTRKVRDPKNLEGVAAADRIDITYTQAVVAHVERVK